MGIYTLVRGAEYGSSINQPPASGLDAQFMGWEKEIAGKKAWGWPVDSGELKREKVVFRSWKTKIKWVPPGATQMDYVFI